MANEELVQRGYLATGKLAGTPYGDFEELNIGATNVGALVSAGVAAVIPTAITFPFASYRPPKRPKSAKPDRVFLRRVGAKLIPVAVAEHKAPRKRSAAATLTAGEQSLYAALALGVNLAISTNGSQWKYIDVGASVTAGSLVYHDESRDLNPGVLDDLLTGTAGVAKDPQPLAETVWQIIWHATKEEPKECLLTFVEIFVLKFLSDNLPLSALPEAFRFYALVEDPARFKRTHGLTAIEYYVATIRPKIKELFPDKVIAQDPGLPDIFGLKTIVSGTSIINGFAFLKSSDRTTLASFNRTFREILQAFKDFGPLSTIDPEFKLRLYETFLKRSARQQRLGQFFTPRNIVRSMIRMARLSSLPDGALVLDPAAGVGGFILEPMLIDEALPDNLTFERGRPKRRLRTVGVDLDTNTHILAKANMLLHLAEAVRDPKVTLPALSQVMAETFVLMNEDETLGALRNPVREAADVILTNPPYVTQGSKIYRDAILHTSGTRNGVDLGDYYDRCGLGVEALFLRYISGALKPGGRAFVIVPLGMLNRTEPGPKSRLLEECDIIAAVELPRNAFFNTAQPTCILGLEKRHSEADARPDVFCAMVRTTGETLDHRRIPTPDQNDLEEVATLFLDHLKGGKKAKGNPLTKVVPATGFSKDDRWDVSRFWQEHELVALGFRESAIDRSSFIDEVSDQLTSIASDLGFAKDELQEQTSGPMIDVSLADEALFLVRSGTRIRSKDIRLNPGDVPVYSCFTTATKTKGSISEAWLNQRGITIESKAIVTVMANGASAVGLVFARNERCVLTDDVIAVEVLTDGIDVNFLAMQLRSEIERGNFVYEAKLFTGRVRTLGVQIPIRADGSFDLEQQKTIAAAMNRFESIRERLYQLGTWCKKARIYSPLVATSDAHSSNPRSIKASAPHTSVSTAKVSSKR